MEERINKPRVFLSHSKKNVDFIENLANDLRKCQIEPWLDTDQIRHGKSWQDSIFEFGLPTCDAVIVYFTEISIQSVVVKKEMDVGLLQNLKDSNIAFLPYVSDERLRQQLRPDIQALQVPEWNETNYHLLLPRVVAEIWRSYLERTIDLAVKDERLKRVQLELELEKRNNQSNNVFSPSENAEFEHIRKSFDKVIPITLELPHPEDAKGKNGNSSFDVDLLSVVATLPNGNSNDYVYWKHLYRLREKCLSLIEDHYKRRFSQQSLLNKQVAGFPDLLEELRMFGLVEGMPVENANVSAFGDRITYNHIFTNKLFRWRYWLAYNNNLAQEISMKITDYSES